MRRLALALPLLAGCAAQLHHEVRVERGEMLRQYERSATNPAAGVSVELAVHYPELQARFSGYDGCRVEQVEEYPETRIDDVSNPAAGPSLATGITTAVVGAGLLAFQPLFSNNPDTHVIDASGHYGAPPRQGAQIGGWVGVGIGIPALAVALVGYLQTGSKVTRTVKEELVHAQETPCHQRPLDGEVILTGRALDAAPLHTKDGAVTLSAAQMRAAPFDGFIVAERNVLLTPAQEEMLASFDACAHLLDGPKANEELPPLARHVLLERRTLALACNRLAEAPASALLQKLEGALGVSASSRGNGAGSAGFKSFDEAMARLAPRLTLAEDSVELSRFAPSSEAPGTPVRVLGIVSQRLPPDLLVLEVGELRLLAELPAEGSAAFDTELPQGTRVEVVGVWLGTGATPLARSPQLSIRWMRRTAGGGELPDLAPGAP